jgi:hypothetical protein
MPKVKSNWLNTLVTCNTRQEDRSEHRMLFSTAPYSLLDLSSLDMLKHKGIEISIEKNLSMRCMKRKPIVKWHRFHVIHARSAEGLQNQLIDDARSRRYYATAVTVVQSLIFDYLNGGRHFEKFFDRPIIVSDCPSKRLNKVVTVSIDLVSCRDDLRIHVGRSNMRGKKAALFYQMEEYYRIF